MPGYYEVSLFAKSQYIHRNEICSYLEDMHDKGGKSLKKKLYIIHKGYLIIQTTLKMVKCRWPFQNQLINANVHLIKKKNFFMV